MDQRVPDIQHVSAEPLVVPVSAFEDAVDEESQNACCVFPRGFIGVHALFLRVHCSFCHGAFPLLAWVMNSRDLLENSFKTACLNTTMPLRATVSSRHARSSAKTASMPGQAAGSDICPGLSSSASARNVLHYLGFCL